MFLLLDFDIPWANIDGHWYGFVLQFITIFYSFCGLAIVCDEHMVPALDTLCHRWGIGEDVAGATFMAFGSAAPEIIINVVATIQASTSSAESTSLGVSAIIGSGMIAFSLIPAACGLFAKSDLKLKRRPLFRDEIFYIISLCILIGIIYDDEVHVWEAALLVITYSIYLLVIIFGKKIRKWYWENVLDQVFPNKNEHGHSILIDQNPLLINEDQQTDEPDEDEAWKIKLRDTGFEDFIPLFDEQEWHDPNLWCEITIQDFERMGVVKGGRIAKFKKYVCDPYYFKKKDELEQVVHVFNPEDQVLLDESYEESDSFGVFHILELVCSPLIILFDYTCPNCEVGEKYEKWYLFTFFTTLVWVAAFSFLLSSVVERWVHLSGVPMVFFGLILVSLGAEVPDTIESVSVAKKGYGSMAVSNCQGTQVINICIGLGLTWLMTTLSQGHLHLSPNLKVPAFFQLGLVLCNMTLLLGFALATGANKVILNKTKSYILIALYVSCISGFGIYLKAAGTL